MKDVSVREPFDRGYLGVSALYGEQEARATGAPSSKTVQEPQTPCSQPRCVP